MVKGPLPLLPLLLALLALSGHVFAQETAPVFRSTRWGMTVDQVKATETATLISEEQGGLMYHGKVAGLDTTIMYQFNAGLLVRAGYQFKEPHINKTDYIEDYKNVTDLLTKKYGAPMVDRSNWKNDLFRGDPQEYGTAVAVGHLVLFSEWDADSAHIQHVLSGDNFTIMHGLIYLNPDIESDLQKQEEEKSLEDF